MSPVPLRTFRAPCSIEMEITFPSWMTALAHFCDHVLTPPEMDAWTLLLPRIRPLTENPQARFRFGREAWSTEGVAAREYLDDYLAAVERSVGDADRLGWTFTEGSDTLYFGPEGLLVIVGAKGRLRSAYLPAPDVIVLDFPDETVARAGDLAGRSRNPFPREGRLRAAAGRTASKRRARPDGELLDRFRVFRNASGEVRSRILRASNQWGSARSEALDRLLAARRDFETWRSLVPDRTEYRP